MADDVFTHVQAVFTLFMNTSPCVPGRLCSRVLSPLGENTEHALARWDLMNAISTVVNKRRRRTRDEVGQLEHQILAERVEQAIRARIDLETREHAIEIERAEVESMKGVFATWQSILRPDQKYPDGPAR